MRLLVGGAVLASATCRRDVLARIRKSGSWRWVLIAAASTGLFQVAFMHAVAQLGAALATAIALGVAPVATGLCARWWDGTPLRRRWAIGTSAASAGCVMLLEPGAAGAAPVVAVLIAVAAGVCYGAYTVAAKRYIDAGAPMLATTAVTLLIAGIALSPVLLITPGRLLDPNALVLTAWTGIACTALAYAVFTAGLRRLPAATVGTLSLIEPLAAAGLGFAVLHEAVSAAQSLGAALLFAGLVIAAASPARRRGSRTVAPTGRHSGDDHAVLPTEHDPSS